MQFVLKLYTTLLFSCLFTPALAQEYLFDIQHISNDDGLIDEEVIDIIQDQKEYIWISSPGSIHKYDGDQFKTYTSSKLNIGKSSAVSLAFDKANNLWYFEQNDTNPSCYVLDTQLDSVMTISAYTNGALKADQLTSITPSTFEKGVLFITTKQGQIYQYKESLKEVYTFNYDYKSSFLSCHQIDKNKYWILDEGRAIHLINGVPTEYSLPLFPLKFVSAEPTVILEIQDTPIRYIQLVGEAFTLFSPSKETEVALIPNKDNFSGYFAANQLQLIYKNFQTTFKASDLIRPCNNCRIHLNKTTTDQQGNLWMATDEGMLTLTPKKKLFTILARDQEIVSVYHNNKTLWIGGETQNRWLHTITKNKTPFLEKERIKIAGFAADDQGEVWVAAGNNLLLYGKDKRLKQKRHWEKVVFKVPFFDAQNNQLLIGTEEGLVRLELSVDTFQLLSYPSISTNAEIRQIYKNTEGIWLVTSNGLFLLNPITLELIQDYTTTFPTKDFYYFKEDKEGIFWLATKNKGLIRWDRKSSTHQVFMDTNGVSNEELYAIYEDDFGNLWLPSKNGLNCYHIKDTVYTSYSIKDGIAHDQFHPFAHFQSDDGTLYFGGKEGITQFQPNDLFQKDTTNSPFYLSKIQVLKTDSDQYEDRTSQVISSNKIYLATDDKVLQIQFNLLDFRNLKAREYASRIIGYQDQWISTMENKVTFFNLPYGKYLLQIKAKGSSGEWSKQKIELQVEIATPLYHRRWFQLLLFAVGGVLLYLGSQWRIRSLQRDKELLEVEVQKRTRQIELDKETIELQAEELKELDKAKTRFFSNITHEFRTPLTLIIGPTEQIIKDQKNQGNPQKLKGILGNARHLLGLINQLLDLSKIEGRQMNIEVFHGDLIAYTQELIDRFQPIAKKKKIQLASTSKRAKWKTYFDKDKWDKILINLFSNAIKFTPSGGKIQWHIKQTKKDNQPYVFLEVKDTGVGIEPQQLDKIFDRFYQVDSTSTRIQQGTGIGLSLVKELIELQGGNIQVQSEVNKGTTFNIFIPVLKPNGQVKNHPEESLSEVLAIPTIPIEQKTIPITSNQRKSNLLDLLIIEDNAEMRQYIKQCLHNNQYNIMEAANGAEGIELAIENIPDLIISDVMMPIKDGFEVTEILRQNIRTSHIPIVLLTAKASLESRLEGLKRGADAYLSKPFSPNELAIRVDKLIELRQLLQNRFINNETALPSPIDNPTKFTIEDEFYSKVVDFINHHLSSDQLNGELIGTSFNMSRMQLHRKIKALTNLPVSDIIRNIRLEKALFLLKEKPLNVSEVAYQTGFNSPSHFSRLFKAKFGKTPSEFKAPKVSK